MSSKFEQLLDYLVNEEHDKADALFHEIVVEKSREIYENLIAEEEETEDDMEEATEEDDADAMEEEAETEEDDAMEESTEETVESMFGEEEDEEEFPVQDQTDDAEDDMTDHDFGGEEEGGDSSAPADKGDIQDLEDALEELKAEFEALMASERNEEENEPGVHDDEEGDSPMDDMDDSEEDGEEEGEKKEGNPFAETKVARTQGEKMREYIEKVSVSMVDGGGVGSGTGDKAGQTGHDAGKSPISSGSGKPTSGANANNIAQAGKGEDQDGTAPKGKVGGLVKTGGQFTGAGTKNVAASASARKPDGSKLTGVSKPGNAEGKPVGAGTGQNNVTGATNTRSIESGK